MNGDFSELIEYLDKKFQETAKKEEINERFEKVDEKFDKLFEIFATKEDLKEAIKNLSTKEDFRDLQTSVDAYAQKADTYFQKMVMLSHKVDRLEKWVIQIAEKVEIKLEL